VSDSAGSPPPRFLDRVRQALQTRHYSRRTEKAYVGWIRRYILFHGKRHPTQLGAPEVTQFLTALAVDRHVAASTQNQALGALLFLYREVLEQDLLMALLFYGSGLRLLEACRLRVQDVDPGASLIVVRDGKGAKDRITMLPVAVKAELPQHLEQVRRQHAADLQAGAGWVELPDALGRKYPAAGREWGWQWVFPATRWYFHRETRQRRRHHLHESVTQRAVKEAVRLSGIAKHAKCHTFATRRNPPARGRLRHPDRAGAARPPGRRDDDDLHPRPQPRAGRRPQPRRPDPGGVGDGHGTQAAHSPRRASVLS
jgi:integrase